LLENKATAKIITLYEDEHDGEKKCIPNILKFWPSKTQATRQTPVDFWTVEFYPLPG
jgi:hypothetical protein